MITQERLSFVTNADLIDAQHVSFTPPAAGTPSCTQHVFAP